MYNITIFEDSNSLELQHDGEQLYRIINENLPQVREKDGVKYSEWIEQLYGKRWVTSKLLYEIAAIIVKKYPDNSIDWNETFFSVEKFDLIDKEHKKQRLPVEEKEGIFAGTVTHAEARAAAWDLIKFASEFDHEKTTPEIRELVVENLKLYNILK